MEKKREVGLDIIRSFAILFVICVHFFLNTKFYETPITGMNMYFQVLMHALFMSCIPLFIMLTGYVNTKVDVSLKYFKKIIPVLFVYVFYSIVSIVYRTVVMHEVKSVTEWIIQVLTFRADAYSWYINMYFGLFLMSPFLNIIFNNLKNKRERQYLLAVFLLITSVPQFLNGRFSSLSNFPNYWVEFYPVAYYFVGCYIREYKPKLKRSYAAILLVLTLLFEAFCEVYIVKGSIFINYMGTFGSLIRLVQAIFIFLVFYQVDVKNSILKTSFTFISMLSLDIYLASYITDKIVYDFVTKHLFSTQENIILWFLPIVLISFIMALLAGFIRSSTIKISRTMMKSTINKRDISA